MTLASCIGCGCDDLHACVDDLGPCSWIVVDRDAGRGVCSCCESHMERWNAGDRSVLMLVAKITRDGETEPLHPHFRAFEPGGELHESTKRFF